MALVVTETHTPEKITRNRRTQNLKRFTGHTKSNVYSDAPVVESDVPWDKRAAIRSETIRKANHANRQI